MYVSLPHFQLWSREKISKEKENMNAVCQLDLKTSTNTPSNNSRICILPKCTWLGETRLSHKTSLNTLRRNEIIQSMLSDHNGMKVEINYEKKTENFTNICRSNIMLLNNQWVKVEFKKILLRQMKMEIPYAQTYGKQSSSSKKQGRNGCPQ